MNYEPDDPRLTAYALDELNESERREMDAHLLEDPEARRVVDEIRTASELLSAELKKESAPKLHAVQRAVIRSNAAETFSRKVVPNQRNTWDRFKPMVAGIAAMLVVSVGVFWTQREDASKPRSVGTLGYATNIRERNEADVRNGPAQPLSQRSEELD